MNVITVNELARGTQVRFLITSKYKKYDIGVFMGVKKHTEEETICVIAIRNILVEVSTEEFYYRDPEIYRAWRKGKAHYVVDM